MHTGWLGEDNDGQTIWYWFDRDGSMQTGWKQIDETWYYFSASGKMATGTQINDGFEYIFNEDGAWVQ